ncbi:MAG: type II toxin-antitoxin system PemK/MazF family toxin [Pyrinomonadaceae bacterium]|nr:type II toxin-antitoxin system PemK/MazF family toxin [Blastocatellia bacterium]MDQ3220826.1 type II toxin-antitoxin system PemK/MazF family toxin [Acidobacteriota bacterium]MDQ3489847.1 type II toxin-antitoxin system PemK/MazF family toxin [Acidobacteriota bacterium]
MSLPLRGEIWLTTLDPTIGREQSGTRPALIISDDLFNQSHAELVVVLPITSKHKGIRSHVPVSPPEGGLNVASYIKCEDVRSISIQRFGRRLGKVTARTMNEVENRLRIILVL